MSAALARRTKQKAKQAALLTQSANVDATDTTLNTAARVQHLLSQTDSTSHYEALQLLSSNTHRSLRAGAVPAAIATSHAGVLTLLKFNHTELANQLAAMYIETLTDSRTSESDEIKVRRGARGAKRERA